MARGEVGKVGVPVAHLGHMRTLLDGIPPGRDEHVDDDQRHRRRGCSALYVANAEEQGVAADGAAGHHPERHRQGVPVAAAPTSSRPSRRRRLIVDMVAWCAEHAPKWNPMNVCSYHLQEAGATPVQEIAYSLATAIGVLDAVRDSGQVDAGPVRRRCSARSRSSSTPASASSRRSASCGPSPRCGTASASSATASPTPRPAASATACRSTRSASPRPSPRTTCSASCSRCSASRCRSGPGPARCSCRRGTRRSACPGRGTSSGRCACSRCWPSRPTCSSTTTSSTART